jgi:hypothetical protein
MELELEKGDATLMLCLKEAASMDLRRDSNDRIER